ncbi:MAG: bifunctional diguanylate cyclase/phosphodiesterase [Sideroxydans sp.]
MPGILPVEKYRTTARAQFLADRFLSSHVGEKTVAPLREIIDRRRLNAVFQPIINLGHADFTGFEGLIRGPADSPLQMPVKLFGAAEQHGLSLEVEMLARQTVLEAFARQNLPGNLFLNVSPETLSDPAFKNGQTLAFLRELGIDPARIVIELTENQPVYDFAAMRDALLHYRAMGFRIAIDDLGEGFSSLRMWLELRPEFVKIDMSFVQGCDRDPIKSQFLKSIQHIAASCGTQVIAEGIETEAELRVVKDLGIALGQGYFIARPNATPLLLAGDDTRRILRESNGASTTQCASSPRSQAMACKLTTHTAPACPDAPIEHLFERFYSDPALHLIPIVDNGTPLGLINRHSFIERFSKPFQRELHGKEPCQGIIAGAPLLVEKSMPIAELSHFLAETDSRHLNEGFIITENGRYLGVASGQDLLRELTRMQLEAARYANPLTSLPGNVPINDAIEHLLQANVPFVACYTDLDHFKPFNDIYGYGKGDEMIRLTGRILNWACDPKLDFIGHIGGDDFVLLLQSPNWQARCEQALRSFEQAAKLMFAEEHRSAGGYATKGRDGKMQFHPLTSLSIGALKVTPGEFTSYLEVSAAMTDAKKMAKKIAGNSLFVEQRTLA